MKTQVSNISDMDYVKIIALDNASYTDSEIAKDLGLDIKTVRQIIDSKDHFENKDKHSKNTKELENTPKINSSLLTMAQILASTKTENSLTSQGTPPPAKPDTKPSISSKKPSVKPRVTNQKSKRKQVTKKNITFSMEDKIKYCDRVYGKGKYEFLTREETKELLMKAQEDRLNNRGIL